MSREEFKKIGDQHLEHILNIPEKDSKLSEERINELVFAGVRSGLISVAKLWINRNRKIAGLPKMHLPQIPQEIEHWIDQQIKMADDFTGNRVTSGFRSIVDKLYDEIQLYTSPR